MLGNDVVLCQLDQNHVATAAVRGDVSPAVAVCTANIKIQQAKIMDAYFMYVLMKSDIGIALFPKRNWGKVA